MSMTFLFHLSDAQDFHINLTPASLEAEGFVHLSSADQVLRTAQRWFAHTDQIKLVLLSEKELGTDLVWEDTHGHGEEFPHLYAPIPAKAIAGIICLNRDTDGQFKWPENLLSQSQKSLLLESLTDEIALIEPTRRFPEKKLPKLCVLCFFPDVLSELANRDDCRVLKGLGSEIGAHTVYVLERDGLEIAVCHPGVGGPLSAACFEELIALGCQTFLLCGGAGSLLPDQTLGHLVVPNRAFRDEGLSHHYQRPTHFIDVDETLLARLEVLLNESKVEHTIGASWTTDALYRETPSRIQKRRESGCLTVEMEFASLLAVAKFRKVSLAAILYCGDDLSTDQWNYRNWTSANTIRERLFNLALELLPKLL